MYSQTQYAFFLRRSRTETVQNLSFFLNKHDNDDSVRISQELLDCRAATISELLTQQNTEFMSVARWKESAPITLNRLFTKGMTRLNKQFKDNQIK